MQTMLAPLSRRPRIYDILHALHVVEPISEMTRAELQCLARHARGHHLAVEIGTQMGKSASQIAHALDPVGRLYCIDPWQNGHAGEHPCLRIAKREFVRQGIGARIVLVIGKSGEVAHRLPSSVDFMFVDGDHSYEGLATDWNIVGERLALGGTVCLHDTSVATDEPWRALGSAAYFDDVVIRDPRFLHRERCDTLNVLMRVA